ncbi:MAG: TIGR04076 family protein [Thermoanaerobaculales bacterium]|nr:TIGR04076 family protein [Thermoanaerobaculales bacterium]
MPQARISVLQRVVFRDLVEKELPEEAWSHVLDCEFFRPGQTFTVRQDSQMPEGFCPTAWHDLRGKLAACLREDNPLTPLIVCCMDGLRPVTFRIERLED